MHDLHTLNYSALYNSAKYKNKKSGLFDVDAKGIENIINNKLALNDIEKYIHSALNKPRASGSPTSRKKD
jgi:hypothetical protein